MLQKPLREYVAVSAEPTTAIQGASTAAPSHGPSRAGIDVRGFPWIRPLAGDYAFHFSNVAPLYAGDPTSADAWRSAIERTQAHPRARTEIAAIVAAQQARRLAPPAARAAAALLRDTETVAVITGQQAGAFGGPLFTLLKALTAIQLARRTASEHGVPAVAIFWVDSEDHDWEEVRACTVLDSEIQPRTVTLAPPDGAGERPVTALVLDERIDASLDEMARALATTDFTDWVMGSLRAAYRPGIGMADAFARWLESVLGQYGLVVFESADPAAKPLVGGVFTKELAEPGRTAELATLAGDELAARGHQPQVVPQAGSISLFHIDGARLSIRRGAEGISVGDTPRTLESLQAEAAAEPARFSPNVLLRPIVQDTLFPTICYVAGPSELAYLGQLQGVYEHFGVPMPLMYPRASATLIDSAAARFLSRYGLPLDAFQKQDEAALNRLLESQLPPEVEASLRDADDTLRQAMQRVIEAMPSLDPTLTGAASTTLGKIEHDLRALHGKVIHAAKRRNDTLRRQFGRAQAQIFPMGHPQERTLAVIFFLNRYGPALVDRLLSDLPIEMGQHWVLTI